MGEKRIKKKLILLGFAFGLFATWIIFYLSETKNLASLHMNISEKSLTFSQESGFYSEDIEIRLERASGYPNSARIYYTLDGSVPTETAYCYSKPIEIESTEDTKVITVRAVMYYKGEFDKVWTNTYVVGSNVEDRYSTPVVSIASDDDGLYGHENGILIPGKLWEEYFNSKDVKETFPGSGTPANYNEGWTREAHVTIFLPDGECTTNQLVGMTVGGNQSVADEQKTLILEADEQFDSDHATFSFDYWRDINSGFHKYKGLSSYRKIKLRNFGQESRDSLIRGAACSKLAYGAGLQETAPIQYVVVYLNGSYYGMAEMQPSYSKSYISDLYDIPNDDVEFIGESEIEFLNAIGYKDGSEVDVTTEAGRNRFEEQVDVENLLTYYAIEAIIDNTDWPWNNLKAWRYIGSEYKENSIKDGRYRFLLFDMDATFESWGETVEIFPQFFYEDKVGGETNHEWALMATLMKYQPYKEKFVNIVCDLLSTSYSEHSVANAIDSSYLDLKTELPYWLENTSIDYIKNTITTLSENLLRTRENAVNRIKKTNEHMWFYFDAEKIYMLHIDSPEYGNTIHYSMLSVYGGGEDALSYRYTNYPVTLYADIAEGQTFSYWLVNGEKIAEKELVIDERWTVENQVDVMLITEHCQDGNVIIDKISAKGSEDFIELFNGCIDSINLNQYYLSNDMKNLMQYRCPNYILAPGETLRINCKDNPEVNQYITNFNLKSKEILYLYRSDTKELVNIVEIPDMNENEIYERYQGSNQFVFTSVDE